MLIQIG